MTEFLMNYCRKINISLTEEQAAAFDIYAKLLVEWNEKMNLTAITDEKEIAVKHFADSLVVLNFADFGGKKIIDVGTGAGFPGLPVSIAVPDADVMLLDSLNKRIGFLNEVCIRLGLKNVKCIHSRAEDGGNNPDMREKYDICVSRAVAPLNILAEFNLPFVKKGGLMIALKGPSAYDEAREAQKAVKILGGGEIEVKDAVLPDTDLKHTAVIIKKISQTPKKYPRSYGKIKKSPL